MDFHLWTRASARRALWRVKGDYGEARKKMFDRYGDKWAFQYSAEEWDGWKKDPRRAWYMEKEMCVIE